MEKGLQCDSFFRKPGLRSHHPEREQGEHLGDYRWGDKKRLMLSMGVEIQISNEVYKLMSP